MDPIVIIAGAAAAVCVALVAWSLIPKGESDTDVIDRRLDGSTGAKKSSQSASSSVARQQSPQFMDAVRRAAPMLAKPALPGSDEEQSRIKRKLAAAGIRSETAPLIFLASKSVIGVVVAVVTLIFTWQANHPAMNIFGLTAGLGALGFMLPNTWLNLATSDRQKKIKKGLADALDLMVIMVEAGLGMDAAIQRVGQEMAAAYPELAEEFRIANAEMNMGLKRSEALLNLAERTDIKEVRSLIAVIIQAERFGTSVGKTLRIQSETLRVKRQQAAEEKAQQTAVKLLFPLVLFIFPALMVVIGGPAMLSLIDSFSKVQR